MSLPDSWTQLANVEREPLNVFQSSTYKVYLYGVHEGSINARVRCSQRQVYHRFHNVIPNQHFPALPRSRSAGIPGVYMFFLGAFAWKQASQKKKNVPKDIQ